MSIGGEAPHVDADLCHHDLRGEFTHSRQGGQQAGAVLDRRQGFSHASIHVREGLKQGIDQIEVDAQQLLVMGAHAAAQRLHQLPTLFPR